MKQSELYSTIEKLNNIKVSGCYFLDLLFVAKGKEPELDDMLHYYDFFIENDWMDNGCYIKNPCAILEFLTDKKFTVKKDSVFDASATYIIGYYHNPRLNINHFVVMSKDDKVRWDSIENSVTVRDGIKTSYRLFYEY